jgi:hypothetical protein
MPALGPLQLGWMGPSAQGAILVEVAGSTRASSAEQIPSVIIVFKARPATGEIDRCGK